MQASLLNLFLRWAVLGLGVAIATWIVPGIRCEDPLTLLAVVLLLSFFNAVIRPLLLLFTLPFLLLSLGLGVFLINAFLFWLVAHIVDGFEISGFLPALGGSLVVSLTSLALSGFSGKPTRGPAPTRPSAAKDRRGDVIDI